MKISTNQKKIHKSTLYFGKIFDFEDKGDSHLEFKNYRYFENGGLLIQNGKVRDLGHKEELRKKYPEAEIVDYSNMLIMPGFIDSHIHFPQLEMIASYGKELLAWLEKYTFPVEEKYKDVNYSSKKAKIFLHELLRNGTTTACVFPSPHPQSVDALFEHANELGMRLISGLVLMDRNAPKGLLTSYDKAQVQSENLINKWHKKDRLLYALTPRFAPTSTAEQLSVVKELKQDHKDIYIQTHLSENTQELAWVQDLFKGFEHYTSVYDHYGLIDERSIFAHCIYLSENEWKRLSEKGALIAHCPSSNLFLGSGLFQKKEALKYGVPITLGSDVGAGTSCSMLKTLEDAYKVSSLLKNPLSALEGFYWLTLGGAKALKLNQFIGNFDSGNEADFIVIDVAASNIIRHRVEHVNSIEELLFCLMILGDDRLIEKTYIQGQLAYSKDLYS